MDDRPYASAAAIVVEALDFLVPPARQSVADFALEHRWLNNAGGGYVGRWTHDVTPYLVEPMRRLTSLDHLTVAVVGPGQAGKTVIAENWLLYSVGSDPGGLLWYMQNDDGVEAYVKDVINPLIDDHELLRGRQGRRPIDDSLHFKRFRGMSVQFLSATERSLINKKAPRIVADEIDAYAFEGDVKTLLDVRRQTFGRQSMLLALSHPDRATGLKPESDWTSGVMAIYADSDRRCWYWECPACGGWSSPVPIAARVMTIEYDDTGSLDEAEASAHLLCPINGCVIHDRSRREMNRTGVWIGEGQEIDEAGRVTGELVARDTAGFWIVGAMSPFILGGIGGLVRARVKAEREREVSGEDSGLRTVMVKQWGIPYAPPKAAGTIEAADLVDRAEAAFKLKTVPSGVRYLVASVDCQLGFFEYLVRGFGERGESWIIDRGRILADPATSPDDWDKLLELAGGAYPLADGSGRLMSVRAMGYDSQGAPGVTQQAYAAWTRWKRAKLLRSYGRIAGRDAWSIIPLRGANAPNAPKLQVIYPDTGRRANKVAGGGAVPVGAFNPNDFKSDLAGQLLRAEPGDWYVHFSAELKSKAEPHLWFEQLVAEQQLPNGRWQKVTPHARNEALDLMVMAHVVAHLHGLNRIDWTNPPAWAAEWPTNTGVYAPEPRATPPAPPETPDGVEEPAAPPPAATPFSGAPKPIAPAKRARGTPLGHRLA